jgi:SAM-dependent methyltransferase
VAFSRAGLDVQGIEIDDVRVELARANCADHGLHGCVHQGSVLDSNLLSRLGKFDVITLVDVIEHVLDVPKTLLHVVDLLNTGGVVLFEIPNKYSLEFVAHDGHFNLFGITLLSRPDAMEYHKAFFGFEYDVGEYFDLEFYTDQLGRMGCKSALIASPLHPMRTFDDFGSLQQAMRRSYAEYLSSTATTISPALHDKIRAAITRYETCLAEDTTPAETEFQRREVFQTKYLTDFWTVVAHRDTNEEHR